MCIRSLKARLKRLTPAVIGQDVERDLRRRRELSGRTYAPGLTPTEKAEYAALDASLKKVDEERGHLSTLIMKDFKATHCSGEPLTDEERTVLAELSKRHPPPMLDHSKAFVLALTRAMAEFRAKGKQ